MLNRLMDDVASRSLKAEKVLVKGDTRQIRRRMLTDAALVLVGIGALVAYGWLDSTWWALPLGMIVGWMVGRSALATTRRAHAYRNGWLDGRHAMVASMGEAGRRGMSMEDWLEGELVRDMGTLGIRPGE